MTGLIVFIVIAAWLAFSASQMMQLIAAAPPMQPENPLVYRITWPWFCTIRAALIPAVIGLGLACDFSYRALQARLRLQPASRSSA